MNVDVPLSISNSADQVELAMKLVKDVINDNPEALPKWIRFKNFDDQSFVIAFRFAVEFKQRHKVQTEISTEIAKRFQKHNIEFSVIPYMKIEKKSS